MLSIRFYTVMGELCAEATQFAGPSDGGQVRSLLLGRIYRRIEGGVTFDDLWLAFQDIARDHSERGYHDDLSEAFEDYRPRSSICAAAAGRAPSGGPTVR